MPGVRARRGGEGERGTGTRQRFSSRGTPGGAPSRPPGTLPRLTAMTSSTPDQPLGPPSVPSGPDGPGTSAGTSVIEREKTREQTSPGDDERYAHYVRKDKITASALSGQPVVALCGKVWTPGRDPKKYPVCPMCKEIFEAMQGGGDDAGQGGGRGRGWPFGRGRGGSAGSSGSGE